MQTLTNSQRTCFARCHREHHYAYELGIRPRLVPHALGFGSLFHAGLEAWWRAPGHDKDDALDDALVAVECAYDAQLGDDTELDAYDVIRAEELLRGYDARWGGALADGELAVLAVEREFECALVNPATGKPSRTWRLGGKVDAIVRDARGDVWVVEHKTTTADLAPGADYWLRLRIDGQVSTYFDGVESLGLPVRGCLYDVIKKVTAKPYRATPEDERRYTTKASKLKDGTARPAGSLHANQRERDETADEYRARIAARIAEAPEACFQRAEVVRLDTDLNEARADAWMTARAMRECQLQNAHPRNPDACVRYGRFCAYFDVCTGVDSIENDVRFRQVGRTHEELSQSNEETR